MPPVTCTYPTTSRKNCTYSAPAATHWQPHHPTAAFTLAPLAAGVPGDFNNDGKVDAAITPRGERTPGTRRCRTTTALPPRPLALVFGDRPLAIRRAAARWRRAVPEPSTIGLVVIGLLFAASRQRREAANGWEAVEREATNRPSAAASQRPKGERFRVLAANHPSICRRSSPGTSR